jgi:hypothetical protein
MQPATVYVAKNKVIKMFKEEIRNLEVAGGGRVP